MTLHVVILAAGNGKRMNSKIPKVLHKLAGVPMLEHVIRTAKTLDAKVHVVHGNGGSRVQETLSHLDVHWVKQEEQLGTGHAVLQAMPFCEDEDQIMVLYGDVPLTSTQTLKQLLTDTPHNGLGLIVTELEDPTGFGRIVRNEMGNILAIVEHKDASGDQLKIQEINTGILTAKAGLMKKWLPALKNENNQNEYYLTDVVSLAVDDGHPVGGVMAHCIEEVQGVNDRWQLTNLERYYQRHYAQQLCYQGVTVIDFNRIDIRCTTLSIGIDTTLDVNVVLEGDVQIGSNCMIGPNVVIKDAVIGDHVCVNANTVIEGAQIDNECAVGPFARIRPGSVMKAKSKVGNFVEMKKSILGENSKAQHLSYLGDAIIGQSVNIGAGTITCNYDGVNKWQTEIADAAFIGSNTSLVAPVKIGAKATIGAGSVITCDATPDKLTVARAKQTTVKGWKRPQKKEEVSY